MRIFVVGTGRCGSVTFATACRHMNNFTCSHESHQQSPTFRRFAYPDGHIEVDPRLSFHLATLHRLYPESRYVHLRRDRDEVVASWMRRYHKTAPHDRTSRGLGGMAANLLGYAGIRSATDEELRQAAETLDTMFHDTISHFLRNKPHLSIGLSEASARWGEFWNWIGAKGDFERSLTVWNTRHNASA